MNTENAGNALTPVLQWGNRILATGRRKFLISTMKNLLFARKRGRDWLFGALENKIKRMFADGNATGIPYLADVKAQYAISLLRQAEKNIDKGHFSKDYAARLIGTLVNGLFYRTDASRRFSAAYGYAPPAFVTVSPTHRCNLNCAGCYAASTDKTSASLTYTVVDRLVNEMHDRLGGRFIVFSGGEPFMWKDGGKGIIDIAETHPDMFFLVYTNGLLIGDKEMERLYAAANITPGISVEGFEELTDARRGKGTYRRLLAKMAQFRRNGLPFGVSVTATRKNIDVLLKDEFYDFWFDAQGAMDMWMFHYMPIGRAKDTLDLMLTPDERKALLQKWEELLFKKSYFIADFWNSGAASDGCIAYGRSGGYFHVNWNGNISPCVFIPYWKDNINDLYGQGKSIVDSLFSDFFTRGREWQKKQGYLGHSPNDLFSPCSFRDHHEDFRKEIMTDGVNPEDPNARAALEDPEYFERLTDFDRQLWDVTNPMWRERAGRPAATTKK